MLAEAQTLLQLGCNELPCPLLHPLVPPRIHRKRTWARMDEKLRSGEIGLPNSEPKNRNPTRWAWLLSIVP